jgi:hypothetical protein
MKAFKSFTNAAITIAGIELAHRIHKRQFSFGLGRPRRPCSLKVRWQRALAWDASCRVNGIRSLRASAVAPEPIGHSGYTA